ncbi:hypothetical protein [Shewanella sp. MBTL60-007]|uniref:hypothetical protein n=1 Tax=Shewanella sp. MBTL60-007 TaxID=2815911 RepID=UPI001BBDAAE5|nr:hypothetical protein [Shewanella sp. MBTL60-007]GIU22092.1 hypothetical protein TUM3792_23740 [Shewanella sp. MBTL60-007]
MNTFTTPKGKVCLSAPFASIHHDKKQVQITYTPDNYHGWGISHSRNATELCHFNQTDAEAFALDAETKLRTQGAAV